MEVTWILASFRQRATPHFLFLSHPLRCPSPPIEGNRLHTDLSQSGQHKCAIPDAASEHNRSPMLPVKQPWGLSASYSKNLGPHYLIGHC